MKTVWLDREEIPHFNGLGGDIKTDVLIIGGGLAGVLCAYKLAERGVNYVLIERDRIMSKVSGFTTAKITAQHGLIYAKLIKGFSVERARQYYKSNTQAIEEYRRLCENIDCNFETMDSFVYSLSDKNKIEAEISALRSIGADAKYKKELPLPFSVAGAVNLPNQAQFDPVMFAAAISKNLNIYEQTVAREFANGAVITNCGRITAKKIIVATHFPFINKHGLYFLKMYQHRSYVVALEGAEDVGGMYVDEAKEGLSFRNYKNLLLLGGGSHRTGKKGGSYGELMAFAKKHYPNAKARFHWATQDCMTLDGIPYIGRYSKQTTDFYVATGFNKWGMTSSMVAANLLCDMVMGKQNEYTELYSPSRSILRPQLVCNAFETTVSLLTFTSPRCPHLGCALKWNSQEHSWDCPCHGSRFSEQGKLLDNPATGDLEL
ncbi:MAG: FAD-dependent oxidoreductase [Oscillospiraceae bacterium]|nr:FAD-dependent oxidoreductase [Oscillospiraceae bacterium]